MEGTNQAGHAPDGMTVQEDMLADYTTFSLDKIRCQVESRSHTTF
jgi:hypothetical protein